MLLVRLLVGKIKNNARLADILGRTLIEQEPD